MILRLDPVRVSGVTPDGQAVNNLFRHNSSGHRGVSLSVG